MVAELAMSMLMLFAAEAASATRATEGAKSQPAASSTVAAQPAVASPAAKAEGGSAAKAVAQPEAQPAVKAEDPLLPIERAIIERTNAERARYGLPPLEVDLELIGSARAHAIWMTTYQRLQHTSQMVAENIAMGQTSPEAVLGDWMRSPGHRANILNRSHRRIGVAAYRTAQGTIFWCQQFRF